MDDDLRLHQAEGEGFLGLGWGATIVAGAVVAGGITWAIVEAKDDDDDSAGVGGGTI